MVRTDSGAGGAPSLDSGRKPGNPDTTEIDSESSGFAGAGGGYGGSQVVEDANAGSGGNAETGVGGTAGTFDTDARDATDQAQSTGDAGGDDALGDSALADRDARDAPSDSQPAPPDAPCSLCRLGVLLAHRYSFNGTGTNVTDSIGTAHGTVMNAQLSGAGTLVLAGGGSNQYVALPNHILSSLTDATLEVWVTWSGGGNNQRILDFGSNALIGGKFQATTTVIISPNSAPQGIPPRLRASYSNQVSLSGTFADASSALPTGAMVHVAAVFDGQGHTLSLYLNGILQGQATGLGSLSLINDVHNCLGVSQYSDDPGFSGTYHELRIYSAALTADQIRASLAAGPNAVLGP